MGRKIKKKLIYILLIILSIEIVGSNGISNAYAANAYTPRVSAPEKSNGYYYGSKNIFYTSGYGMPNCTAYAYGRAYELLGTKPALSSGNAGKWYSYNKQNKKYS